MIRAATGRSQVSSDSRDTQVYTGRRDLILGEAWRKQRHVDNPLMTRYRLKHDLAIQMRINANWLCFGLAYVVGLGSPLGGIATLLVAILLTPAALGQIEKRVFGLAPITRFLAAEVAMDRVLCFSDGVYSIAMTLVVLDITGKDRLKAVSLEGSNGTGGDTLHHVLAMQGSKYLSWVLPHSTSPLCRCQTAAESVMVLGRSLLWRNQSC